MNLSILNNANKCNMIQILKINTISGINLIKTNLQMKSSNLIQKNLFPAKYLPNPQTCIFSSPHLHIQLLQSSSLTTILINYIQSNDLSTIQSLTCLNYPQLIESVLKFGRNGNGNGRVVLISLLQVRDSYLGGMVKYGVRSLVRSEASRNIMHNVDVVSMEFNEGLDIEVVRKTIHLLMQDKIAAILHSTILTLKKPQQPQLNLLQQTKTYTLVTGGSRGIGLSTCRVICSRPHNILLTGRPGNSTLKKISHQLSTNYSIEVIPLQLDISNQQSIIKLVQNIKNYGYVLDGVVYNAAVGTKTSQEQAKEGQTPEDVLIKVNSVGPVKLHQELEKAHVFIKHVKPNVIIVSSVGAERPFHEMNAFDCASKAILDGWINDMNKSNKFNVITICPGATDTEMFQKSTTNSLKSQNKLQKFIQLLPKKMMINPQQMGQIIAFFTNPQIGPYFSGQIVSASCGLNLDYKSLPSVPSPSRPLTVVQAYFQSRKNPYSSKNPTGIVNFDTSFNSLVMNKTIQYFPEWMKKERLHYGQFTGGNQLRQIIARDVGFNKEDVRAVNSLGAVVDLVVYHFKELSISESVGWIDIIFQRNYLQKASQKQSKCHIIVSHTKDDYIQYLQKRDKYYLIITSWQNITATCNPFIIYACQWTFSPSLSCGCFLSKCPSLLSSLTSLCFFYPLSSCTQCAILSQAFLDTSNLTIQTSILQMLTNEFQQEHQISQENVFFGDGATNVIEGVARALFVQGDVIGVDGPFYPTFKHDVGRPGVKVTDYLIDDGRLIKRVKRAQQDGCKGYIVNTPHNPTGIIFQKDQIQEVCQWAQNNPDFHLIFDQLYANSIHGQIKFYSCLQFAKNAQNIHSIRGFAQDFGMCGLKIGLLVTFNTKMMYKLRKWQFINRPHPYVLQLADTLLKKTNYGEQIFNYRLTHLKKSISTTIQCLNSFSIPYLPPSGGCFIWIDLSCLLINPQMNQYRIWKQLFQKEKVFVAMGEQFSQRKKGWCRIATIMDQQTIRQGVSRIANMLRKSKQ